MQFRELTDIIVCMELLIATKNAGKVKELSRLLQMPGFSLLSLADFPDCPDAVEDGSSFEDNALIKASLGAYHSGLWTLADDSGLAIDALNGLPGINSARFAGPGAGYAANNAMILEMMRDIPPDGREARFVCVMCLVGGNNRAFFARGEVLGRITSQPKGNGGFGYDPIFQPDGSGLTFAEMPQKEKDLISHRAKAVEKIRPLIAGLFQSPKGSAGQASRTWS